MKFFIQFFFCGILTSFLFPPFFLIPIGFIVFTYIFYLLNNKEYLKLNYYSHFFSGFLYGLGFFSIYLEWIKEPFLLDNYTKNFSFFSYLLVIYCSLFFGFIFSAIKYFKNPLLKWIMFPVLIVIAEFICGNLSYGFPWFSFSLIYSGNIYSNALIYYFGTYGLSYIVILVFLLPTMFFFKKKNTFNFLLITYSIFLILLSFLIIVRNTEIDYNYDKNLTITLAQLNFPINQQFKKDNQRIKYNYILEIIKENKSDILVFGENNYPYLMNNNDIKYLQKFLHPKTNLIIGSTRKDTDKYFNSLFLINKKSFKKFDKQILVPFGEFIPFRFVFSFMDFIAGSNDYSIGNDKRTLMLSNDLNVLPAICYEIIYFWRLLDKDNFDSDLIINLTNDSWFGEFSGPYQHFYFTRMRAVEFNKPLIRLSSTGISAIIDNYGNIIDYIELNKRDNKTIQIAIPNYNANYRKFHHIIMYMIWLLLLIGFLVNKKNAFR